MAITSILGTGESTLASEMAAGQLFESVVVESVSSNLGLTQQALSDLETAISNSMTLLNVASFEIVPSDPKIPLIIDNGTVQQNFTTLDIGPQPTRTVDGNHTMEAKDRLIVCLSPGTISLLPAADFAYRRVDIKSRAVGSIIIDPDGAELIDDDSTKTLTVKNESLALISDGSRWLSVGGGGAGTTEFLTITDTDFASVSFYYYGGTDGGGDWVINRYDKPGGGNKATANEANNPTHTTLATAWAVRGSLTYA